MPSAAADAIDTTRMSTRQLAALILASALVTLDGTATTIALPAIARDLSASVWRLQWIANAPLLMLAAMLLPGGALAERLGRGRVMRIGLLVFAAASLACLAAASDEVLIAAKAAQGAGAALVLPAALATLRTAYSDAAERARIFGVWAAWTGAAAAAGPLLAGGLVDLGSWRFVFVPSAAAALAATRLLRGHGQDRTSPAAAPGVPAVATLAVMVLLGGVAYLLMHAPDLASGGWPLALPTSLAAAGAIVFARDGARTVLLPRELLGARNCVPANAATFAFYFGMFGLSLLIVLYVQQVREASAMTAAIAVLPMSLMLLLAERFGRLTARLGTRWVVVAGALLAAGGIAWAGLAPAPLPFWRHLFAGAGLFGLGMSLSVSALTHAAVAAVPERCAGPASAVNHAVVRVAGLFAVALLGSIAAPGFSDVVSHEGVRRALLICAATVAGGGVAAGLWLRDDQPGGLPARD